MRAEVATSTLKIFNLESEAKLSQEKVAQLNLQVKSLNQENEALKITVDEIQNKLQQNDTFVGFSAYATATRPYNNEELVLFDAVHTNYGGAYDPELSVFVCPVSGYYLFSVNIQTKYGDEMRPEIYLQHGGPSFARTYADSADEENGSTMVITYCEAIQRVWVRGTMNDCQMYGDSSNPLSTFSGVLLQQVSN